MADKTLREVSYGLAESARLQILHAPESDASALAWRLVLQAFKEGVRYALAEPSEGMMKAGNEQFRHRVGSGSCWRAMAAVRLEELK
jgi:hypothetical protein